MDTSRCVSVNTHNSILNITEDDEEDDDDEVTGAGTLTSFLLFDDFQEENDTPPSLPNFVHAAPTPPILSPKRGCCTDALALTPTTRSSKTPNNSCLLDKVTEHFADSLCFPTAPNSAPVTNLLQLDIDDYRRLLESDLYELLGCSASPDSDEIELWESIFNFYTQKSTAPTTGPPDVSPPRPIKRLELRERALRIHRLRAERALPVRSTGLSPTSVMVALPYRSTRSMDDGLSHFSQTTLLTTATLYQKPDSQPDRFESIAFGLEPQLPDGYDSDPGETTTSMTSTPPRYSKPASPIRSVPSEEHDIDLIQESFNLTWTLTWHTACGGSPVCCRVWMERGTLVNFHTMLEPQLMWRPAFQPMQQRKLDVTANSIRLLNLCRIRTADSLSAERKATFPLARWSCCILLKSEQDEYVFEAHSPAERDDVVRRWKLAVARFATLAVMEDMESICHEFFTPTTLQEYKANIQGAVP